MSREWPEPVRRVAALLEATAAEGRIEEFAEPTPTAADAARAVGCDLRCIVKSLLCFCDGRPLLALVPGDRRASLDRVARAVGAGRARIAAAAEVEPVTGFAPGAVAPFPLAAVERVLIDRRLLGESLLWVGAGSTKHLAGLPAGELVRLTRAEPVDISDDA